MVALSMEKGLPVASRSRRKTKMVETKDTERAMDERVSKFQVYSEMQWSCFALNRDHQGKNMYAL